MAYTVISVFPETVNTEEIKTDLKNNGFHDADVIVSTSRLDENSSADNYIEDEKTQSFWNHIFANENEMLDAYSKESVGKINVVVYTSTVTEAQDAKKILDQHGALKVYNKPSFGQKEQDTAGLPEDVYNGIIAKAKHDVYFLDRERSYSPSSKGMSDTMDDLGSKD